MPITTERLRAFLAVNKIFFETVAAIALTGMSLVVSWKSLEISKQALLVSREAEDLAEAQVLPVFSLDGGNMFVDNVLPPTDDYKEFLSSYIWLENTGQPLLSWNIKYTTLLELEGTGTDVTWIPLTDPIHMEIRYHGESENELPQQGVLAEFRERRWFDSDYSAFLKRMQSLCGAGEHHACQISAEHSIITIAEVSYKDKLGRAGKSPWYFMLFSSNKTPMGQEDLRDLYGRAFRADPRYSLKQLATLDLAGLVAVSKH